MPAQAYRILVVDDILDNLFLLQTVLETEGYAVETAENGAIALQMIQAAPPDLVLLDIMMPGINGYEVARRIRSSRQAALVPIVFMTAHDELSSLPYAEIGINDLIRKPVDFEELFRKIEVLTVSEKAYLRPQSFDSRSFKHVYEMPQLHV